MEWYSSFKSIGILACFAFITSCSYNTIDGNKTNSVTVKLNEKFRINLAEDHSTGYTWQLNDTYDKKNVDHFNTVWEGNTKGVYFYFKAIKKGETVLSFTSRMYEDVNMVKEVKITVTD